MPRKAIHESYASSRVFRRRAWLSGCRWRGERHPTRRAGHPALNAVELRTYDQARNQASCLLPNRPFAGVPSFIKDNTDVMGLVTRNGSAAYTTPQPAKKHTHNAAHFLDQGYVLLGKSPPPEYGFLPSARGHDTRQWFWQCNFTTPCGSACHGAQTPQTASSHRPRRRCAPSWCRRCPWQRCPSPPGCSHTPGRRSQLRTH